MTPGATLLRSVLAPRTVTMLALLVAAVSIALLIIWVVSFVLGAPQLAPTRWSHSVPIA